jgi:hypothetical protein
MENRFGEIIRDHFDVDETFFLRVTRGLNVSGQDRVWFHFKYRTIGLTSDKAEVLMHQLAAIDAKYAVKMISKALGADA